MKFARERSSRSSRRSATVPILALTLALVLAACGDNGEVEETEPADTEEAEPEDEPEEAPEETEEEPDEPEAAENPFEGETITFAVPYSAGGGYDTEARLMAPLLEEITGATVNVLNDTGAGGLLADNNTMAAGADDNRIQYVDVVGSIGAQLGEAEGARADLNQFQWLGRFNAEPRIMIGNPEEDFTFEDVLAADPPGRFALTGPGSHEFITLDILEFAFEFPAERIAGFDGSSEMVAAMLRGDVNATILSLGQADKQVVDGEYSGLLVFSDERVDSAPDVPALSEFELPDPAKQDILNAHSAVFELSRSIAAPPSMPAEKVEFLREAFAEMFESQEFQDQVTDREIPTDTLPGWEVQELITAIMEEAPPEYRERLVAASQEE